MQFICTTLNAKGSLKQIVKAHGTIHMYVCIENIYTAKLAFGLFHTIWSKAKRTNKQITTATIKQQPIGSINKGLC